MASGAGLGAGLIIAIGAQNAFVLRRGILRSHVLAVVAVCIACDWVLIAFGAAGFGTLVAAFPLLTSIAAWGGAAFLFGYGAVALRSAVRAETLHAREPGAPEATASTRGAVLAALAVSLLNPHVYLDTVVLLGGLAGQYEPVLRVWFAGGAMLASAVWFTGLGFGARVLAPVFERPAAWRVLDIIVAFVMWWIAAGLVRGQLV